MGASYGPPEFSVKVADTARLEQFAVLVEQITTGVQKNQ